MSFELDLDLFLMQVYCLDEGEFVLCAVFLKSLEDSKDFGGLIRQINFKLEMLGRVWLDGTEFINSFLAFKFS